MKTINIIIMTFIIGGVVGFAANQYFGNMPSHSAEMDAAPKSNEPLYWVAPMDANYQRDKPGKSPMGMDLVPVYAEDGDTANDQAGTVKIDPAVENNLGVKSENAVLQKLSPRINTVGYIAFDESRLWQVNVRVAGWVDKLYINAVGERVTKGDVLFTLYSPDLVNAQDELINAYRTGRRALINGATERLVSLGVDRVQIREIVKKGKVKQTIAVKALADGVIATLNIREGGYISPTQSIISGGPLDEVWVDAEVFERQAEWVVAGIDAEMTVDAISGQSWQGKVDYVYPILNPETRTLRLRLKFANPQQALKPNMFANITLQPQSSEKVLTIPRSAVIRAAQMTRVVLAEGEGKYRSARIQVGREVNDRVEVLEGLTAQDKVVTSAHFLIDSESSQSADLSRINGVEPSSDVVWTSGEVIDVMLNDSMLTLHHQPVPEWDWPAMTMNFNAQPSLNIKSLEAGTSIDFAMQKSQSGQYEIIEFKEKQNTAPTEVWIDGDISMLMADFGMVTLQHGSVAEWNWESGEMNFSASSDIDLSIFKEGQAVRFLILKKADEYTLEKLESREGEK